MIGFSKLIVVVVYLSHVMACSWLGLGQQYDCKKNASFCTKSWAYTSEVAPGEYFIDAPYSSVYIFAFYWIFEVITTVGYGDYSGSTEGEYIFSILVEFIGLTFFSFFMGTITELFSNSDNFEDLIEKKLDNLDLWIKKIEKSNKPYHIQPNLYNNIRTYVEHAFKYDFNLVVEEFDFYHQITPKMQSQLIKQTRVFHEFENNFNHFFEDCERGFTNEFIIHMCCRIF